MDLALLRRWWPLAAVIGLLSLTALAATRSAAQLARIEPADEPAPGAQPSSEPRPSALTSPPTSVSEGLPDWVGLLTLAVAGALVAVLIGVVTWAVIRDVLRRRGRRIGKRRSRPSVSPRTAEELVAALDAGLSELSDNDIDPRRAVIACWVRLEQAAAAAGTVREPGDTPTDLVGRLLTEQRVDASVLAALADVYREARYATHTVDDRMRAAARSALQRLRADLGGAPPLSERVDIEPVDIEQAR